MAERQMENQEPEELNLLENQLKDIRDGINSLLMAPKQEKDVGESKNNNSSNAGDLDSDELAGIWGLCITVRNCREN